MSSLLVMPACRLRSLLQDSEAAPPLEPLPPSQLVPAHLLRTLRASIGAATPHSPAALLLLAAHAAMLETGFVPSWACRGSSEAGGSSAGSAWAVPASAWASAGLARVAYHLAPGTGDDTGGSAMEAEPAGEAEADTAERPAAGASCTLHCSSLGGGRCVLAVATRGHTRHLALQAADYVQPWSVGQGSAPDAAGASSSTLAAASNETLAAPACVGLVQLLPGGGLAVGGMLALQAASARELWRRLKDGLAFPMLLAAYAEAGLHPPAGLLALPEELKQRVLGFLGVSFWLGARSRQRSVKFLCDCRRELSAVHGSGSTGAAHPCLL